MPDATVVELQYLEAIRSLTGKHGYPPTFQELGEGMLVCKRAAHDAVSRLRRKGMVTYLPNKSRTLRLTTAGLEAIAKGASHAA